MNKYLQESVNRFLGWKLPKDFAPDAGITFKPDANTDSPEHLRYKHEPVGTNLFTADQAEAMLTHVAGDFIQAEDLTTALLASGSAVEPIKGKIDYAPTIKATIKELLK